MKRRFPKVSAVVVSLCLSVVASEPSSLASVESLKQEHAFRVVERGQDFAVLQNRAVTGAPAGPNLGQMNRFTLLENALHYFENGEWKESQDLIEPFPAGAIARHGPHKAIFSPDLNAEAVFDIETTDGSRLRGGVRAIHLTETKTGQSVVLASVKRSAPGELVPPAQIAYPDAFDGLRADVVLVWRHNLFSHDVVLRERPQLPAGWDPAAVRLEVLTELVECPEPEINRQWVGREGVEKVEDHVVLDFGQLVMLMGHGFPVEQEQAWTLGGLPPAPGARPILKRYHALADGRRFLVESIAWSDAAPQLAGLPAAQRVEPADPSGSAAEPREEARVWQERQAAERETGSAARDRAANRTADTRFPGAGENAGSTWPPRREWAAERKPIALAQAGYAPAGYVLDFVIIPDQGTPTTLASGQTYYIKSSYYSGSSVTFQPDCVIKYKDHAYMLLYGPVSFPGSGTKPVFTSRNDDGFGERIVGVPGEADSNGDPTLHRGNALWI